MNPKLWKWFKFAFKPHHIISMESPIYAGFLCIVFVGIGTVAYINNSELEAVIDDGIYIPLKTEYNSFKSGMRYLKEDVMGFKKTTDSK